MVLEYTLCQEGDTSTRGRWDWRHAGSEGISAPVMALVGGRAQPHVDNPACVACYGQYERG